MGADEAASPDDPRHGKAVLEVEVSPGDRLLSGSDLRRMDAALAVGASVAMHAVFLLMMILRFSIAVQTTPVEAIPVQVVLDVPPGQTSPFGGLPKIEDVAKKAEAPLGALITNGQGSDRIAQGAPEAPGGRTDSQTPQPLHDWKSGEAIAAATPKLDRAKAPAMAPPGVARVHATVRDTIDAAGDESAIKAQKISCGLNSKRRLPTAATPRTFVVLGFMPRQQALAMIQQTQWLFDMHINGNYIGNARVFVHREGAPPDSSGVALLPSGLRVKVGDRIEVMGAYLDPSQPCQYVPALARRVL